MEKGINLAGPEFAPQSIPGVQGRDYHFPGITQIVYYKNAGFTSIRLPFMWERLQPVLFEPLDKEYLAEIIQFMDKAAFQNQRVLLDMHNYGRYRGSLVGSSSVTPGAFHDLWERLARAVSQHKALLAYGLMNEPHGTGGLWHKVAQDGVDGVRAVDTFHDIYVAGDGWSNVDNWVRNNPKPFVTDPKSLIVYEAHSYFDADSTGRYSTPLSASVSPQIIEQHFRPFLAWLAQYGQRGVIGEWGVPSDDSRWLDAIDNFMEFANKNCLSWYYWGGGLSANNNLTLEPIDGRDRPQMVRIRAKLR